MRKKHEPYQIVTECWFPLGHGDKNLLSDTTIATIAKKHNKTIVQIILRWHIQEGFSVIPGNTNPEWIKENISIFDFKLDDEDMKTMRSLNQEKRFYNMSLEQLEKFVFARQIRK
jgi:diketogulonate reductase-like aldo/keto reductase